jgi:hypothetical protein
LGVRIVKMAERRDFSPNERGIAMAERAGPHNLRVNRGLNPCQRWPIDNNPTPSYLSNDLGRKRLLARFASHLPESSRIPERRNQNPAAPVW